MIRASTRTTSQGAEFIIKADYASKVQAAETEVFLPVVEDEEVYFSKRAPLLRAFILGANDGLVSVASLMLGVGAGTLTHKAMLLSGVAGMVAGALSMACGEYISVASQRDAEEADIRLIESRLKGEPAQQRQQFNRLVRAYMERGVPVNLAHQVAQELEGKDALQAHAREELSIDIDDLANPLQACVTSMIAFSLGALVPLLSGAFIDDHNERVALVTVASTVALAMFGAFGAWAGGSGKLMGAMRVVLGGLLAMGVTYAVGAGFKIAMEA